LTDEFSCANSRFFRTVLYPNEEVSSILHDRFVLHWQMVRPVPTVTIDFGDGRKLERTLTGNSIHYILDSDARPLDALPGLYGPRAFARGLLDGEKLFKSLQGKNEAQRNQILSFYYGNQHNRHQILVANGVERDQLLNARLRSLARTLLTRGLPPRSTMVE
jgi:hypothetical protein